MFAIETLKIVWFSTKQVLLKTWQHMQLPTDPISMDTMCIFSQEESSDCWALLCDPQRIAITWVLTMLGHTTLVKYKVTYLFTQIKRERGFQETVEKTIPKLLL